ncbi:phosphoglycolate phosphatase [Oceanobacter kriegii]|uniref:phosphoglycolate phosphatase n=1 Tax=Oceanobacter kriegii TaxID=64972 RepID=UPI000407C3C5|nr:phosphoglycolate phosphatase [Oceanobacter kriegii]
MSIWNAHIEDYFSAVEGCEDNRPEAVLFDLDGTLIDSVPDLARAVDAMLVSLNRPAAGEALVAEWVGNGADMLVRRALADGNDMKAAELDAEQVAAARVVFDDTYLNNLRTATGVYPGVQKTLTRMAFMGVKMAMVTNKPRKFTEPLIDSLGWGTVFDFVVCGDDLEQKKPDPGQILHACQHLGAEPTHCIMVGDSRNDMFAGKAAGCMTVAVPYGYNHGENIATAQPNRIIQSLEELLVAN